MAFLHDDLTLQIDNVIILQALNFAGGVSPVNRIMLRLLPEGVGLVRSLSG